MGYTTPVVTREREPRVNHPKERKSRREDGYSVAPQEQRVATLIVDEERRKVTFCKILTNNPPPALVVIAETCPSTGCFAIVALKGDAKKDAAEALRENYESNHSWQEDAGTMPFGRRPGTFLAISKKDAPLVQHLSIRELTDLLSPPNAVLSSFPLFP